MKDVKPLRFYDNTRWLLHEGSEEVHLKGKDEKDAYGMRTKTHCGLLIANLTPVSKSDSDRFPMCQRCWIHFCYKSAIEERPV